MADPMTDDIPALVARLEALAHRYDMTHTERYEADSEAFYAATGYMAPGKDVPMAVGGQNEQERRAAHEAWIAGRNMEQQYAIRDAAAALSRLSRALAERDAELAQMEQRARRIGEAADETIQQLIAARRERNEAREALTAQDVENGRLLADRAELSALLEHAERERDEARAQLAAYEKAHAKARP